MKIKDLPSGWKDISLEKYANYMKTFNISLGQFDKIMQRLSILTGIPFDEVANIKLTEISKIEKALKWVETEDLNRELIDTFTVKGVDYKITLNATELTGGQYASIVTNVGKNEPFEVLHEILASLSLPVGTDIKDIEPSYYSKTAELFAKELSIADVYSIGVFFCEVSKNLTVGIQDYLSKELKKMEKIENEVIQDFINNGDGSQLLTTWLEEMEQSGSTTSN